MKFDQPGFGLKNPTTGDVEGFDVEIAKLIVAAIGDDVEIEFVEAVSKNREPFIQDGTVDMVVATYTINDTRKQVVDFAGPYFVAEQDIMVKADDTTIKSVDDLNGKKVCTVKGSTSAKNLVAKAPAGRRSPCSTPTRSAPRRMTDGRVEAVTTDNTILAGLVQASDGAFKLVEAPFSDEPYGIGVKKDDDAFRDVHQRPPRGDLRERRLGRGVRGDPRQDRARDARAADGRPLHGDAAGADHAPPPR